MISFILINLFLSRDEAIELADHAIAISKTERIEEFNDLLKEALDHSKTSMEIVLEVLSKLLVFIGVRRRKSSVDKSQDEEEDGSAKQPAQDASVSPTIAPETIEEINPVEKSVRKPLVFSQNGDDEQVLKKKRGRKPKSETNNNLPVRF